MPSKQVLADTADLGSPVPAASSAYWTFYAAVAAAQLAAWLPDEPRLVLDLSGDAGFLGQLVAGGHEVVSVCVDGREPRVPGGPGQALPVAADLHDLRWLRPASIDLVVAESRALSSCLAIELTLEQLAGTLRPGGRLLLTVDSLQLGLARLAEQGRWAELANIQNSDVVLIPGADGSLTRCFLPEELTELLAGAGLEVDWVRPRSVLTPATVERALAQPGDHGLRSLVRTECTLSVEREGTSGLYLVASARKPA